jgi:hypothetical protein
MGSWIYKNVVAWGMCTEVLSVPPKGLNSLEKKIRRLVLEHKQRGKRCPVNDFRNWRCGFDIRVAWHRVIGDSIWCVYKMEGLTKPSSLWSINCKTKKGILRNVLEDTNKIKQLKKRFLLSSIRCRFVAGTRIPLSTVPLILVEAIQESKRLRWKIKM